MKTKKEIQDKLAEILASPKPDVKDIGVKFGDNYLYKSESDFHWAQGIRDGSLAMLSWVLKDEVN